MKIKYTAKPEEWPDTVHTQFLSKIEDPAIRKMALLNHKEFCKDKDRLEKFKQISFEGCTVYRSLWSGFIWDDTPQGGDFWVEVADKYRNI